MVIVCRNWPPRTCEVGYRFVSDCRHGVPIPRSNMNAMSVRESQKSQTDTHPSQQPSSQHVARRTCWLWMQLLSNVAWCIRCQKLLDWKKRRLFPMTSIPFPCRGSTSDMTLYSGKSSPHCTPFCMVHDGWLLYIVIENTNTRPGFSKCRDSHS